MLFLLKLLDITSFLLLLASLLLVAMPFVTSSFLLLVVRPGDTFVASPAVSAPKAGCWSIGSFPFGRHGVGHGP